jgi:hypothetical protein
MRNPYAIRSAQSFDSRDELDCWLDDMAQRQESAAQDTDDLCSEADE